jgi:hypothetical protein
MALSVGQRVTLLKIDDCLAMTHRYEFEVREALEPQAVGYQGSKQRVAVVRQRGKRKDVYLDLAADDIVLDGWGLPFRTDGEAATGDDGHMKGGSIISGNACFNLVGEPEAIRQCIEGRAVVPVSDSAKAKIIVARSERTTCSDDGQELLYPEIESHHAVVNRMRGV